MLLLVYGNNMTWLEGIHKELWIVGFDYDLLCAGIQSYNPNENEVIK
jgi:hypothetical protein